MGDLHSIAYSDSSSLGWDFHNLGVFNADMSHFMDSSTPPPFFSALDSSADDHSTGYLQDALFEFSSKRRRLLLFSDVHHTVDSSSDPIKSYWNSNHTDNFSENFSYMSQITDIDGFSGDQGMNGSSSVSEDGTNMLTEMKSETYYDSSSSSPTDSSNTNFISDKQINICSIDPISTSGGCEKMIRKKRVITRVVYPFALVKPGGTEGDVTLNDINERILMPPTRPVRHPVGDFACRPLVSTPDGPGLSGKAVVALTKIHTQGRGTITIIRTKG